MQNKRSSPILVAAGLMTAVLLPSCSLPPGVAWREIQRDGLIPFMQNGMNAPKAQSEGLYAKNGPAKPVVVPPKPAVSSNVAASQPAPQPQTAAPLQPAYAVAGLTGYVRSPYTNPPRLVDVRGMGAGSKVVCPYTQRPFVVPAAAIAPAPAKPAPMVAKTKPQPKPQAPAVVKSQPKPTPAVQPAPTQKVAPAPAPAVVKTEPKPAPAPTPAPKVEPKPAPAPQVKPKPVETPKVAATPPAPEKPKTTPPPAPAPAAAAPKLPFGTAINGRPGFVNSPYAEKHQLVDVTGLAVGTEVKCPYTGKLFRVPPQQQAKK